MKHGIIDLRFQPRPNTGAVEKNVSVSGVFSTILSGLAGVDLDLNAVCPGLIIVQGVDRFLTPDHRNPEFDTCCCIETAGVFEYPLISGKTMECAQNFRCKSQSMAKWPLWAQAG